MEEVLVWLCISVIFTVLSIFMYAWQKIDMKQKEERWEWEKEISIKAGKIAGLEAEITEKRKMIEELRQKEYIFDIGDRVAYLPKKEWCFVNEKTRDYTGHKTYSLIGRGGMPFTSREELLRKDG